MSILRFPRLPFLRTVKAQALAGLGTRGATGMWEGRRATRWQTLAHELRGVVRRARADRRYIPRDITRLLLGGWRTRRLVTRMVALTRPHSPPRPLSDSAATALAQLRARGFTDPLALVTPSQTQEIRDYFLRQTYVDPYRPHLGRCRYPDEPAPESNQGYYDLPVILQAPHLLALFNHPLVLATAERLLGCKPTLDNVACWWYFAGRSVEKGFQRYHRDYDTPRFLKLFLYLTDTDLDSGAQRYVVGSQRDNRLMLLRYIDDDEVAAAYGTETVRPICGPAGTCFLVDTFGVHKGGLPSARPRLVVAAQYNIWGSPLRPRARSLWRLRSSTTASSTGVW